MDYTTYTATCVRNNIIFCFLVFEAQKKNSIQVFDEETLQEKQLKLSKRIFFCERKKHFSDCFKILKGPNNFAIFPIKWD